MREPRRSPRRFAGCALVLGIGILVAAPIAGAAPPPAPTSSADAASPPDATTERASQAFRNGVKLAKAEQWGDALVAFEAAAAARDAALVQFNIAYCPRALGRYVSARETTKWC